MKAGAWAFLPSPAGGRGTEGEGRYAQRAGAGFKDTPLSLTLSPQLGGEGKVRVPLSSREGGEGMFMGSQS